MAIDTRDSTPLEKIGKSPRLTVYRASAGSGKTFTLAVEYISLLMKDPTAYRNILAVTFTNKATAEMKERILSQLYGISVGDKGSDAYLAEVCKKTGLAEDVIRKKAGESLHYIIHDYTRFHVETIDSFSVSVMRNLAKELSVGSNMNIELNSDDVLSEAVDTMVENLNEGVDILNWLSDYIMERIEESKSWKVFNSIKKFGRQIFNEQFVEHGTKLKKQLDDSKYVDAYKKTLSAKKDEITEELKKKGDEFFDVLNSCGIPNEEFNGNSLSPAITYFRHLQNGEIDKAKFGSTLEKIKDNAEEWTKKKRSERVVDLAASALIPLLCETEEYRGEHLEEYNSYCLSLEHLNDLRLLAEIDKQMNELNHLNNRYLLADINKLLRTFVKGSDTPFVFEKIGTTISNIMMDEFQDTSRLQWDNFKPLIMEGLANGNDSLIVGDVKQSIYRWRNGDWKILNEELNRDMFGVFPIKSEKLETNHRSAPDIIAFNNAFFQCVRQELAPRCKDEAKIKDTSPLEKAYADVCQSCPDSTARGYAEISIFLPNVEDYNQATLEQLSKQLHRLKSLGIKEKDIAILVRSNDNIKWVAEYLNREKEFKIVSNEAFRLDASVAIGIIIDAMRCLSLSNLGNKESKLPLAQLTMAYQQEVAHQYTDLNDVLLSSVDELLGKFLPKEFCEHLDDLRLMPLYELVEKLYVIFGLVAIEEQDGYLCAFFDAVADYCDTHPSELSSFVSYWDETLYKNTLPVGEVDGIRVLTIHKAKGLEFHTVLIPFCDWKLEVESTWNLPKIWCKPEEKPYNDLDLLPITYKEKMAKSIYAQDYEYEKMRLCVDNVNLLYVAFTRAKENLFVWTSQDSGKGWNIPRVLKDTLNTLSERGEVTSGTDEAGEITIFKRGTLQAPKAKEDKEESNIFLKPPKPIAMHLHTIENTFEFRQSNRSAAFIDGESEGGSNQFIDRGLLLHNLFSCIRTKEDVPQVVERLRTEGVIDSRENANGISNFVVSAIESPDVKAWFDGSWQLFNECSIIYEQEGQMHKLRPDRVMIKDGNVVVLDYKFGKKHKSYHTQVKEYMDLLTKMGYHNVKGYLWYVFDNGLEEVSNG